MDFEEEVKNNAPQEQDGFLSAESEVQEITSEKLKATTKLDGWLGFMIFLVVVGGIHSLLYPFITYDLEEWYDSARSNFTLFSLVLGCILTFALAMHVWYSFYHRLPNSIFLAISYIIVCLLPILYSILCGWFLILFSIKTILSLVIGVAWICYLQRSEYVAEVIPREFRKASRSDYAFVASVILIPLLLSIAGLVQGYLSFQE